MQQRLVVPADCIRPTSKSILACSRTRTPPARGQRVAVRVQVEQVVEPVVSNAPVAARPHLLEGAARAARLRRRREGAELEQLRGTGIQPNAQAYYERPTFYSCSGPGGAEAVLYAAVDLARAVAEGVLEL